MSNSSEQDGRAVVRCLRQAGFEAYFAGGCVRDRLMGLEPKDHDVATNATPDQVQRVFRRTLPVGKSFGVMLVRQGDSTIEVATFRADGAYLDGRRPESVRFADLKSDVQRRDFTVNGMMLDPETGAILDHVGGQADLNARVIRAIGDPQARFGEDHLRLIRAIRFACKLDFTIEPATWSAIQALAPRVASVSGERVRAELERIFATPRAARGLRLLEDSGLRAHVLPETGADPTAFALALSILDRLGGSDLPTGLAAVFGPLRRPADAARAADRLRLSRKERDTLVWLVQQWDTPAETVDAADHVLKRLARAPDYARLDALFRARWAAEGKRADVPVRLAARLAAWTPDDLSPTLWVNGDDLRALGFTPGRAFARILTALEDEQLDGRLPDRETGLRRARELEREFRPPA